MMVCLSLVQWCSTTLCHPLLNGAYSEPCPRISRGGLSLEGMASSVARLCFRLTSVRGGVVGGWSSGTFRTGWSAIEGIQTCPVVQLGVAIER